MAEKTIQVNEKIADFIGWANVKGQEEIRRIIRERLDEIKEQHDKSKESHVDDGYEWDDVLEKNDGADQWKHGGDCNLCRKLNYCATQCRANRLLKKITTPYLYKLYLEENPDAAVKAGAITPESIAKQLGVLQ